MLGPFLAGLFLGGLCLFYVGFFFGRRSALRAVDRWPVSNGQIAWGPMTSLDPEPAPTAAEFEAAAKRFMEAYAIPDGALPPIGDHPAIIGAGWGTASGEVDVMAIDEAFRRSRLGMAKPGDGCVDCGINPLYSCRQMAGPLLCHVCAHKRLAAAYALLPAEAILQVGQRQGDVPAQPEVDLA